MDAPTRFDDLVEEFLAESNDDLIGLWEIVRKVAQRVPANGSLMEETLAVVRELLAQGLAVGDPPYSGVGYRPWPDQNPDSVVERIRSEWLALGRDPNIPDMAWFGRTH